MSKPTDSEIRELGLCRWCYREIDDCPPSCRGNRERAIFARAMATQHEHNKRKRAERPEYASTVGLGRLLRITGVLR